jgi:hypothetical protein
MRTIKVIKNKEVNPKNDLISRKKNAAKEEFVVLTREMLRQGQGERGGWGSKQIKCLGGDVSQKNWIKTLIGKKVPKESFRKFIEMKNQHLVKKKDFKLGIIQQTKTVSSGFKMEHIKNQKAFRRFVVSEVSQGRELAVMELFYEFQRSVKKGSEVINRNNKQLREEIDRLNEQILSLTDDLNANFLRMTDGL